MIVDTSVFVAILREEPEEQAFKHAMLNATSLSVSAGSWVELGAVMGRRFRNMDERLPEQLRLSMRMAIEPVSAAQAHIAYAAYRRFGQGSNHPAKLNFGDCFSYALAKATGEPLLFKGDDFSKTDIVVALPPLV